MGSKTATIQKRKKFAALFERGRLVHFTPEGEVPKPTPDSVSIWVGPPNPLQREQAIRDAQAARSRAVLSARRQEEGSEYVTARAFVEGLTVEALIDYVIMMEEPETLSEARREVLSESEWEDFNSLRDSMREYEEAGLPSVDDAPEWGPLLEKDRRFGAQVEKEADRLRDVRRDGYKMLPRAELEKKIIDRRVDQAGSAEFMVAYDASMLFFGCRDDEHHDELFFEHPRELQSLPQEIQDAIKAAYDEFVTEAGEAKNLRRADSGSASSEPPVEPETSEASGPEESSE